jgi:hypothetical protein
MQFRNSFLIILLAEKTMLQLPQVVSKITLKINIPMDTQYVFLSPLTYIVYTKITNPLDQSPDAQLNLKVM